ncbi:MAG: formate dehydrogenase accessory protein FdhE [Dehalococcoidales bacterium]|nr:MAG: formate dehydrogenase accessory protein FdhE [Dehalococcoidales bacterium]
MSEGRGNGTLKQLEEKGNKIGLPSRLIEFYQNLLDLQARGEQKIGKVSPGLKKEVINERLAHGRPLINYNEIDFDWKTLNELFVQVTNLFLSYSDLFGEPPESMKGRKTIPRNLVKAWYKKSPPPPSLATDDADGLLLMDAIIHATVKPNLVRYARALSGFIQQDKWKQNICPVCGGLADLAYLEEKEGARWLVCSRCDTEWLFKRLECPYCKNNDQSELAYYTDEDSSIYRLYVCEKCRKYIKAIDLRATEEKILFPVERILTINIDNQAREEGYEPDTS